MLRPVLSPICHLALAAAFLLPATGGWTEPAKVRVVATTHPLADWVAQVGGDRVEVTTLMPAGASPHTYEPRPSDLKLVAKAHVFVSNGLGLDDWATRIAAAGPRDLKRIALGDLLRAEDKLPNVDHVLAGSRTVAPDGSTGGGSDPNAVHDHDHSKCSGQCGAHGIDPHFWLDPLLARECIPYIVDILASIDPDGKDDYQARASKYEEALDNLHAELDSDFEACEERSFVAFHNAWSYMGARYGLRLAAVIEEYPGKEPSDRYLKGLIDQMRELKIRTVFAEPQFSPRVARILAAEVGGKVETLDPYGAPALDGRSTYADLMRYNARTLIATLDTTP